MLLLNNIYSDYQQSTLVTKLTGDKLKQLSSGRSSVFSEWKCVYVYMCMCMWVCTFTYSQKRIKKTVFTSPLLSCTTNEKISQTSSHGPLLSSFCNFLHFDELTYHFYTDQALMKMLIPQPVFILLYLSPKSGVYCIFSILTSTILAFALFTSFL